MIRLPLLLLLTLTQSAIGVDGPLPPRTAPPGLEVELRTVENKTTFGLSELVPLEVAFRTSKASTYAIEIADGWNLAPAADRFVVEPSRSVIDRQMWLRGIVCCDSRRAFLTSKPAIYTHELTDFLRFTEPGEYRIQYTTRRVFAAPPAQAFEPSDLLVRSNVVTITITEDDPQWVDERLPAALAGVEAPPISELREFPKRPLRGSLTPPTASAAMVRYRQADRQLRMLDTPDAIRARVAALRLPSSEQWRATEAKGYGGGGVGESVTYSSRPDLVATALRERAATPEFGVMRGYFDLWVKILLERDYPALVRLRRSDGTPEPEAGGERQRIVSQQLLDTVRDLNRSKTGVAAEITGATLRQVARELARQ